MQRRLGRDDFLADTSLEPEELVARLQHALDDRALIEIDPDSKSRRRVTGSIDGKTIRLGVRDDRVATRRKSWNIEFTGEISQTSNGSVLRGSIEVPDRGALGAVVRLLIVGACLAVVIAVAVSARSALSGGSIDLAPTIVTLAIGAVAVFALIQMMAEGESAAAIDSSLLQGFLRLLLSYKID
jgi:hypothetical protein